MMVQNLKVLEVFTRENAKNSVFVKFPMDYKMLALKIWFWTVENGDQWLSGVMKSVDTKIKWYCCNVGPNLAGWELS